MLPTAHRASLPRTPIAIVTVALTLITACGIMAPSGESSPAALGVAGTASVPTTVTDASPGAPVTPGAPAARYSGHGFEVHEWGTNTLVVGSDGRLQRGLQHEEEGLPDFVLDRRRSNERGHSVAVKMETPVIYFYAPTPLSASVRVDFPNGVLTQWYPDVLTFAPGFELAGLGATGDPIFDHDYAFKSEACRAKYSAPRAGALDWGTVSVLAADAKVALPDAPLDRYSWSHARAVAANPVDVAGQQERFLFYRGLGDVSFPATVAASDVIDRAAPGYDGGLHVTNGDPAHALGAVFVLRVAAGGGAFTVVPGGLAPNGVLDAIAPTALQPLDDYAAALSSAMVAALDRTGLFHDEALAMVHTWERQWFRTPGVRVLYLSPQAWTEAQIPLSITPKPERLVRVMVIRTEVITRPLEDDDLKVLSGVGTGDDAAARAYFTGLGRFAEPRLRRALDRVSAPSSAQLALLASISGWSGETRLDAALAE
jgi:hypothetical protein